MLKAFVITAAFIGIGASASKADAPGSDPATWRWQVAQILAAQRSAPTSLATVGSLDAGDFEQRYERFSPTGLPVPPVLTNGK